MATLPNKLLLSTPTTRPVCLRFYQFVRVALLHRALSPSFSVPVLLLMLHNSGIRKAGLSSLNLCKSLNKVFKTYNLICSAVQSASPNSLFTFQSVCARCIFTLERLTVCDFVVFVHTEYRNIVRNLTKLCITLHSTIHCTAPNNALFFP